MERTDVIRLMLPICFALLFGVTLVAAGLATSPPPTTDTPGAMTMPPPTTPTLGFRTPAPDETLPVVCTPTSWWLAKTPTPQADAYRIYLASVYYDRFMQIVR